MNYVDFNPEEGRWDEDNAINRDMLLNQSTSEICCYSFFAMGNGFFKRVINSLAEKDKNYLDERKQVLDVICKNVVQCITKEFDLKYIVNVAKQRQSTRVVTVEVTKVRKKGLFGKETYIDHEQKSEPYMETYYESEEVVYKGWLLDRLVMIQNDVDPIVFDYCLGADGKLYVLYSLDDRGSIKCIIPVVYSPIFLTDKHLNIYTSVFSGVVGALDAIPIDTKSELRNLKFSDQYNNYFCNFPIEIAPNADGSNMPYPFLGGVLTRIARLLDVNGMNKLKNLNPPVYKILFGE